LRLGTVPDDGIGRAKELLAKVVLEGGRGGGGGGQLGPRRLRVERLELVAQTLSIGHARENGLAFGLAQLLGARVGGLRVERREHG